MLLWLIFSLSIIMRPGLIGTFCFLGDSVFCRPLITAFKMKLSHAPTGRPHLMCALLILVLADC